jgi:hypothetical protein
MEGNAMQDYLEIPFDTENEEASAPFALLPRDRYKAEIISAMAGPTKNGAGYSVNLKWSITEGDFEHRVVFQSILIQHQNPDAMKFGRQKFKDVLNALGITEAITDLSVMHNKPCLIGVIIREDKSGQWPDKNEIARVMPIPASHNGATRAAIKEAQKVQPAFKAVDEKMSDAIPF